MSDPIAENFGMSFEATYYEGKACVAFEFYLFLVIAPLFVALSNTTVEDDLMGLSYCPRSGSLPKHFSCHEGNQYKGGLFI